MHRAARCRWALGAPTQQQLQGWTIPLLTQHNTRQWQPCRPYRQLHTTLAVRQQQQQVLSRQQLSWQELHRAAQIAAWSGLCYHLPDELAAAISSHHQGLTLVASGRNGYTAWFVADGVVPAAQFCSTISSRCSSNGSSSPGSSRSTSPGSSSSSSSSSTELTAAAAAIPSNGSAASKLPSAAANGSAAAAGGGVCARVAQGTRERFVFLRGVQWSAPDINNSQLSQALMNLWPTQFPKAAGSNGGSNGGSSSPLVAHAGVAGIAQELFSQLRPYMQQADDVGMPLCFAGHSLGGSLAMLLLVLHQMNRRNKHQPPLPSCYTYGSPPVLAHERGGGGQPVLEALSLPPDAINSFVLEMDPVPRALLSVDPTFQLFSGWSAVKGLLQLRELFVGSGSPLSPGRFLFEAVGRVHLIKWTPEGGSRVVPLDAAEIDQELSLLAPRTPSSTSSTGRETTPAAGSGAGVASASAAGVGAAAGPATPGMQLDQQVQEGASGGGLSSAPAAAAGGAAAALMNSLRAWLDHHHRSYAQELEAAALRGVREQLAAEQPQQHG